MKPLLRFEKVSCVRGGRLLFDSLSFEVEPGDGLLVAGPNGTGKSSLIRVGAGLLRAESGTVERADAALADEGLALDRELSLLDALRFWVGDAAAAALETVELEQLASVPVSHLSAGQRKRASLARVVGSAAPLWLLDEPLNALDSESVKLVERLIAQHRAGGGAVLAASHMTVAGDWMTLELAR